jgi:16S rRNA (adenine1518-N6/adenine1519-N6)-dimethyltransferase
VVANVPYYITAKIVKYLLNSSNSPKTIVLLVQKEVAERLAAKPGDLSILAISAQVYAEVSLDVLVSAHYFTPPPKVESQVVVMHRRNEPLLKPSEERAFFRIVKAGFSSKRKKLRSSLSAGLGIAKSEAEEILNRAGINPNDRAEALAISQWIDLMRIVG